MRKLISFFSICYGILVGNSQVINEIMQSNIDDVFVDNEYPDSWVEIYNNTDKDINLKGWTISPEGDILQGWRFNSDLYISAGGYILVYCDKESKGNHANFRLDSGKGELALFDKEGQLMDFISYPKQPAPQISYGRIDANRFSHFVTSSPAESNENSNASEELLPLPVFSHLGGVYQESVEVCVSMPEGLSDDTKLCITFNGNEPTINDAIDQQRLILNIDTTTVVRAKLISSEALSGRSVTQSYLYLPEPTNLPVLSIVTDADHFYDLSTGIFVGELDNNPNWEKDWRRPMNLELYLPNANGGGNKLIFNQLCEGRVSGGWSRREIQKPLVVYSHKRFGKKNFTTGEIWHEKNNIDEIESFMLRNSGGDIESAHIRDAFAQILLARHSEYLDWQDYRPCLYFENGVYKGIYDIRERSNEKYIESNYPEIEEFDCFENWDELKAGSYEDMAQFKKLVNNPAKTFAELDSAIDIDDLINHFVLQSFGLNTDYPQNNIVLWKAKGSEAKWHLILKDVDRFIVSWMNMSTNFFDHVRSVSQQTASSYDPGVRGKLFCFLLENEEAQRRFINKALVSLGDFMQPNVALELHKELADEIRPHITSHFTSWWGEDKAAKYINLWTEQNDYIIPDLYAQRWAIYHEQLQDEFCLSEPYKLHILPGEAVVSLYDHKLTQTAFEGIAYRNYPLVLSSSQDNYKVEITQYIDDVEISRELFSQCPGDWTPLEGVNKVSMLFDEMSEIEKIDISDTRIIAVYDLLGNKLADAIEDNKFVGRPGIYIVVEQDQTGQLTSRKRYLKP